MNFAEISQKTKIVINVSNGTDLQARFISKVMKNTGDHILVIPFRHKGQRINFSGPLIKIHMEVRDSAGVLWSFKNCKINSIKKDGLIFHKIVTTMKNGIENRREGRRFYIWEQALVECDGLNDPFIAHVKDVGISGLSFALDLKKPKEIKVGKEYTLSFKDKDGKDMRLSGMILRKETMDRYMVYGCKVEEPPQEYINYVKRLEKKNTVVDVDY